jgi:hypothetical protein
MGEDSVCTPLSMGLLDGGYYGSYVGGVSDWGRPKAGGATDAW